MSSRHTIIIQTVPKAYPNALHGYCAHYMELNLNKKFKNLDLIPLFKCCSRAYIKGEFDKYMDDLAKIDPLIEKYLVNASKQKWSKYHFSQNRCEIMATNESNYSIM